jgi:polysaccharide deacetylase 2 family uncharacterized protein YibQ
LATLAAALVFLAVIGWIAFFGSAKDGSPEVRVPLGPGAPGPTAAAPHAGPERLVNGNLVADPALLEDTPLGPLPRIGAGGRKPLAAYARPFTVDARPRIVLVVTGLGVSAAETQRALDRLPPQITLAFSPYATNLQTWVDQARGTGHEVLIEVPMEPFDFPDSDPGPRTLLASATQEENEQRLVWTLTRFTGYAGAVNSQGGRFLSEAHALEPVIATLARRGILWVDVSSAETSATASTLSRQKAAGIAGAMRIDAIQTTEAIEEKLLDLEARAKQKGVAVGVASAYPVSIERIAEWSVGVEKRGFALAPATAAVKGGARPVTGGP